MKSLFIIVALFASGCTQNLSAPLNSVPVSSMAEYFWKAGDTELFDSDQIATRDSSGILLAQDENPDGTLRTLVGHVAPDSVTIEGFSYGSIFDLDKGMEFVTGDTTRGSPHHSGGSVVLLRENPLVDSAWLAGILMRYGSNDTFPIEARLLSRLDTLTVSGVSYPDVLAIRYAHENSDFTVDATTVPYWVVFYARGRGPVMFDKVDGTSLSERRSLLR